MVRMKTRSPVRHLSYNDPGQLGPEMIQEHERRRSFGGMMGENMGTYNDIYGQAPLGMEDSTYTMDDPAWYVPGSGIDMVSAFGGESAGPWYAVLAVNYERPNHPVPREQGRAVTNDLREAKSAAVNREMRGWRGVQIRSFRTRNEARNASIADSNGHLAVFGQCLNQEAQFGRGFGDEGASAATLFGVVLPSGTVVQRLVKGDREYADIWKHPSEPWYALAHGGRGSRQPIKLGPFDTSDEAIQAARDAIDVKYLRVAFGDEGYRLGPDEEFWYSQGQPLAPGVAPGAAARTMNPVPGTVAPVAVGPRALQPGGQFMGVPGFGASNVVSKNKVYAVKVNAGHTPNGNPQRGWQVYDGKGRHLGFVDEGSVGRPELTRRFPKAVEMNWGEEIPTTKSYYRDKRKDALGGIFGSVFGGRTKRPKSVGLYGSRWRDSSGNTYHTTKIVVDGQTVHTTEPTYGYGNHYEETGVKWLEDAGLIPKRKANTAPLYHLDKAVKTVESDAIDVRRKKDLFGGLWDEGFGGRLTDLYDKYVHWDGHRWVVASQDETDSRRFRAPYKDGRPGYVFGPLSYINDVAYNYKNKRDALQMARRIWPEDWSFGSTFFRTVTRPGSHPPRGANERRRIPVHLPDGQTRYYVINAPLQNDEGTWYIVVLAVDEAHARATAHTILHSAGVEVNNLVPQWYGTYKGRNVYAVFAL